MATSQAWIERFKPSWWMVVLIVAGLGLIVWWDELQKSTGLNTKALLLLGVPVLAGLAVAVVIANAIQKHLGAKEPDKPLVTLGSLFVIGALLSLWYGYEGVNGSFAHGILLVAVLAAAIAVGGLLGFLFGIPRFDYSKLGTAQAPQTGTPTTTDPKTPAPVNGVSYRPSTNLDDVADWLTKLIVGIALSQLVNIGKGITSIATFILSPCGAKCAGQQGFVSSSVTAGAIGGFLFAYLWTRLHYALLAARSDIETMRELDQAIASQHGIGKKPGNFIVDMVRGTVNYITAPNAEEATRDNGANDDPNAGRFGGRPFSNGRVLEGRIEPSELGGGLYRVTLTVKSVDPSNPLAGVVVFHLHPTFVDPIVRRPVENGIAELSVISYGTFTVGAEADNGETRLELNLAVAPGATNDFRSR